MHPIANLQTLLEKTHSLPDGATLAIPEGLLPAPGHDWRALLTPKARFIVLQAAEDDRQGYRHWLSASQWRRIAQDLPSSPTPEQLAATLEQWLSPAAVAPWPSSPDEPPLAWPDWSARGLTGQPLQQARLQWYRECMAAYRDLWEGHPTEPVLAPVSPIALYELEQNIACPLPAFLRLYHLQLGVLNLTETLCSADPKGDIPIQPLIDAYPGIEDMLDKDAPEWALVNELVVFGDYLGNGNQWCFHRHSGEVWYFDHDTDPMLTRLFPAVEDYLDALMVKCLLAVHDQEDDETLLRQHLGDAVVEKWMY